MIRLTSSVCDISEELVKAGGKVMTRALHAIMAGVWQFGIILDWKRGLIVPFWNGKGDPRDCNTYLGTNSTHIAFHPRPTAWSGDDEGLGDHG